MNRLEDLRNQLKEAEIKAESLKDSKDAAEIMNCVNSIKAIKAQIALEEAKSEPDEVNNLGNDGDGVTNVSEIFAKAIVGTATSEEMKEIENLLVEGEKNKGGVLVPVDVETKIKEKQRKSFDIRKYINVEPVGTNKGSRPQVANEPEAAGFASVDEGAEVQALHEPTFEELDYAIRSYAGFIPMTSELLEDSPENILDFIEKWMAKNELNTYAYQVFNGSGTKSAKGILTEATDSGLLSTQIKKVNTTPTIKTFKTVINKDLDNLDSDNICIFTNADGYDFVDGLEDKKGRAYLQPDATKASGYEFLGKEIVKVPAKFLKNVTIEEVVYTPYIIGDLNLLYTMYQRKGLVIESTKIGGEAWRKRKVEVMGAFRFDGQIVDKEAVKILLVQTDQLV